MDKLLFIYNPNSGKGTIKKEISHIIERFSSNGYLVTAYPTSRQGDGRKISRELSGKYSLLVCAGGDGTLSEVAFGLMEAKKLRGRIPTIGYIPVGTVNDFASSLGIPKEIDQAIENILNGDDVKVDIGSFTRQDNEEKRYFTYVAAFGAFTAVSYETSQDIKNLIGKVAYFMEGIKSIQNIKPIRVQIDYENGTISDELIFGMIANSKSIGGFKGLTGKKVYLDDGRFEAIFVKMPRNILELQSIINSFITLDFNRDFIHYFHTKKIEINPNENINWTMDGEAGGRHGHVVIKNRKEALKIRMIEDKRLL